MKVVWIIFSSLLSLTVLHHAHSQCQKRNLTAANKVGRPCRKPCLPDNSRCRGGKICGCDRECGYSCLSRVTLCGAPSHISNMARVEIRRRVPNGSLVLVSAPPYRYDDVAEYACFSGYSREEPLMKHYCHGRRDWTGTTICALTCRRYSHSKVSLYNMVCGANCTTNDDCVDNQRCLCDGHCGRSCVNSDVDCGAAPAALHATISYQGEGFNRVARYTCNEGYYIRSGSRSRRCSGGGTWDGTQTNCQPITCGNPLPSIIRMGGSIINPRDGPFYAGNELTFECPRTHKLLGARVRTCMSNGQWSGLDTVCDRKDKTLRCPHPGVPVNGNLVSGNNFAIGSFVEFTCNRGRSMVGERRQECLYFLQWSGGGAPKCVDPRLPSTDRDALQKLQRNTEEISGAILPEQGVGQSSSADAEPLHEVVFVIDVSEHVEDEILQFSVDFAKTEIKKLPGRIKCGIIAFASNDEIRLQFMVQDKSNIITALSEILTDRENINKKIGQKRNIGSAMIRLIKMLTTSFATNIEIRRRIFLMINGKHTFGISPQTVMANFKRIFSYNLPEIYVVAFGDEPTEKGTNEELRAFANPATLFLQNPNLHMGPEQNISAAAENEVCGQAGDIGNLKKRLQVRNVLGGDRAVIGAWPWHAVISVKATYVSHTYASLLGGGSLLNERWVLTAAHLFGRFERANNWEKRFMVTFGIITLPVQQQERLPAIAQVFEAAEIITHADYNDDSLNFDVAVIRLGRGYMQFGLGWLPTINPGFVNFTSYVKPVCLPCMDNCVVRQLRKEGKLRGNETKEEQCRIEIDYLLERNPLAEKNFLGAVTGFGEARTYTAYDENVLLSRYLKQGRIRLQNRARCLQAHEAVHRHDRTINIHISERTICAVGGNIQSVTDACRGDSGGAYVREVRDTETGRSCWIQIGVVSWGWGCGQTFEYQGVTRRYPGFYTSVSEMIGWIKAKITGSVECPMRNYSLVEERRQCRKACNSDEDCRGKLKRCRCDNVCGMSCFNPDAQCEGVEPFANGAIDGGNTYDAVIRYQCNNGYRLVGNRHRKCRSDRKWTGFAPTCISIKCPQPVPPTHGRIEKEAEISLSFGSRISYVCDVGYKLEGRSFGICTNERRWGEVPSCLADINCNFADAARPFCAYRNLGNKWRRAFVLEDASSRLGFVAQTDFQSAETSEEARLRSPRIEGGRSTCLSFYYKLETIARSSLFTVSLVQEAFRRIVWNMNQIASTREWLSADVFLRGSDEDFIIEFRAGNFGSRTDIKLDDIVISRDVTRDECANECETRPCMNGGTCLNMVGNFRCFCRRGYEGRTCATTVACVVPNPPAFGSISPKASSVRFDSTITFRCNEGYTMGRNAIATCQLNRRWSTAVPRCQEIRCNIPKPPRFGNFGTIRRSVRFDETVTFRCNRGYQLASGAVSGSVTCRRDGRWSQSTPRSCIVIDPCSGSPCKNGGTCQRNGFRYRCLCPRNIGGNHCDIDYSKCGQAGEIGNIREQARVRVGRVLLGTRTKQGSWPWQVLISRYREIVNEAYGNNSILGGGSIINNRWVLTAAHLFGNMDLSEMNWHEQILLSLGIHKRPFKPGTRLSLLVRTFKAGQIIIHRNFDSSHYDYDIALVKLGQEVAERNFRFVPRRNIGYVKYMANIRPVCLPCMQGSCVEGYLKRNGRLFGNETQEERCKIESDFLLDQGAVNKRVLAVVTGFGHTETVAGLFERNLRPSVYLQQGLSEIYDNETCATFARSHIPWGDVPGFEGIPYSKRMLCGVSGFRGRIVDTCYGDSGGPLVRQVAYAIEEKTTKCWVQIGVISWGWGCGRRVEVNGEHQQIPAYYTNVMEISSWINKTLHENS